MKRLMWVVAFALLVFGANRAAAQDVRYDYDKDKEDDDYGKGGKGGSYGKDDEDEKE